MAMTSAVASMYLFGGCSSAIHHQRRPRSNEPSPPPAPRRHQASLTASIAPSTCACASVCDASVSGVAAMGGLPLRMVKSRPAAASEHLARRTYDGGGGGGRVEIYMYKCVYIY